MRKRISCVVSVMVFCFLFCACGKKELVTFETQKVEGSMAVEDLTTEKEQVEESGNLFIYICGQIQKPGVYELERGSRICDVIEMAGGFCESASTEYWNLAQVLEDGMMIYVPTVEEAKERGIEEEKASDGKIDINTATKEMLVTLPGIGKTRADAIIKYREEVGTFSNIEDIMQVPGIKQGAFDKIKEYIKVS